MIQWIKIAKTIGFLLVALVLFSCSVGALTDSESIKNTSSDEISPKINLTGSCPLIKYIYTADASAIVENGRVYLFMSHDPTGSTSYNAKDLACISSADLRNWRFEGMVFNYTQVPNYVPWTCTYAPCVVKRGNTYYLYYGNGGGDLGVATSANITGPYTSKPFMYRDPAGKWTDPSVFINDDGQAYIYYNGNKTIKFAKLNTDMVSLKTTPVDLPNSSFPNFMEGPTLTKINGKYNLSWITENVVTYQTVSSSPDSGFTATSLFMEGMWCNNQTSIFNFAGNNYSVYHNSTRTGTMYQRDVGICNVKLNANGTMDQVMQTTSPVAQVGTVNPYVIQRANEISDENDVNYDPGAAVGDQYVAFINNGSWVKVSGVNFSTAPVKVEISAASPNSGQTVQVRLDSPTGRTIATINVANSGSWNNFTKSSAAVASGVTGVHDVYFYYSGGINHKTYQFFKGDTTPSFVTMRKSNALTFGIDGNNGGANGQLCYIWAYDPNNINQQWDEIDRGGGYYSYQKHGTSYCLDGGNGGANGQAVYLWTRNDGNQNQHWKKIDLGGGYYRLEKRNAPGFSIDGNNGGANGQKIYLWASDNNNQNQRWLMQ